MVIGIIVGVLLLLAGAWWVWKLLKRRRAPRAQLQLYKEQKSYDMNGEQTHELPESVGRRLEELPESLDRPYNELPESVGQPRN